MSVSPRRTTKATAAAVDGDVLIIDMRESDEFKLGWLFIGTGSKVFSMTVYDMVDDLSLNGVNLEGLFCAEELLTNKGCLYYTAAQVAALFPVIQWMPYGGEISVSNPGYSELVVPTNTVAGISSSGTGSGKRTLDYIAVQIELTSGAGNAMALYFRLFC